MEESKILEHPCYLYCQSRPSCYYCFQSQYDHEAEEWSKPTPDQKYQLCAAKGLPTLPATPREAHSTTVTPIATPIDSVFLVTEVNGAHFLQQTLSNKAAITPTYNDSVKQLKYNGSTYQFISKHVNICLLNNLGCPQRSTWIR
jgi:hypothetical protein